MTTYVREIVCTKSLNVESVSTSTTMEIKMCVFRGGCSDIARFVEMDEPDWQLKLAIVTRKKCDVTHS
jgi:hypothetical protein